MRWKQFLASTAMRSGTWQSHAMVTTFWQKVVLTVLIAWTRSWLKGLKSKSYQGLVLRRAAEWSKKDDIYQVDSGRVYLAGGSQVCSAAGCWPRSHRNKRCWLTGFQGDWKRQQRPGQTTVRLWGKRVSQVGRYCPVLVTRLPDDSVCNDWNRSRNGKANSVASTAVEATRSVLGKVSGGRVDLWNTRATGRVASLHRQRLGSLCGIQEIHVFLFHQVWKTLVGHKLCKTKHSCT